MAINLADNTPRIEYTFTNTELVNAIVVPFVFFNGETDLKVYIKSTTYTLFEEIKHSDLATGSNPLAFTVASGGDGATGTILIRRKDDNSTFTLNGTLIIQRVMAIQRITDYQLNGPFEIATLNLQLDQLTAIAGDLRNAADRTLQIGINDFATNVTVPKKADRIGRVLGFHPTTGDLQMYTLEDYTLPVVGDNGTFTINSALSQSLTVRGGTGIDVEVDSNNRRLTLSTNIDATNGLRSASTFEQIGSSLFPSSSLKGISVFHAQDFHINFGTICIKPDQTNITSIFHNNLKLGVNSYHHLKFTPTTGGTAPQTFDFNVKDMGAGGPHPITNNPTTGASLRFQIDLGHHDDEDAFDEKIKFLNLRSHNGFNGTAAITVGDQFTERDVLVFRPTHNSTNEVDATFSDDLTVNKNLTIYGEIVGNLTASNNVTIDGNLTVNGTTTTVNTATLSVEDPLIALANGNNSTDSVDIGFYGLYDSSGSQNLYAGMYRDATDDKFKLFKGLQTEPSSTVNISGTGYTVATLVANIEGNVTGNLTGDVTGNATTSTTATSLSGVTATATELNYNNVTTLGTVQASKTVTADANGDVKFPDQDKLRFGTGDDLEISHDSNNNIIRDNNAKAIFMQSDNATYGVSITKKFGTEFMARFIPDGSVYLHHDSLTKFFTTATGAQVIGTLTGNVTGDVTGDLTGNVIGAVTGITSVLNTNLVVGRDADTQIDFSSNNQIKFKANTGGGLSLVDSKIYPLVQNQAMDLGYSPSVIAGYAFRHGYFTGTVRADELETTGGIISVKNDGSQSEVRLYCESNNAHYVALQAPAHSAFSGNAIVTLPSATGTLISTSNSDAPTTTTSSSDADFVLIDDGGTMKKITPSNLGIGGGTGGVTVQDEGSALSTTGTTLNFVGAGVVASGTGATKTVTIAGGSDGVTVQDEGSALSTTGTTLNFVGSGVVASGTGATKTITISGGGSGGTTSTSYGASLNGKLSLTSTYSNLIIGTSSIDGSGYTTISEPVPNISTTGQSFSNTIVGGLAGNQIVFSDDNAYLGYKAGADCGTSGDDNVYVGSYAGYKNISGARQVAIGYKAMETTGATGASGYYNTAIGAFSFRNTSSSASGRYYNIAIGYQSLSNTLTGDYNTAVGNNTYCYYTGGSRNTMLGYQARTSIEDNVSVGYQAGASQSGETVGSTFIGYRAGYDMDGGDHCNFIGYRAGYDGGSGSYNNGIGTYAVDDLTSGGWNNGLGYGALSNITSGTGNTGIGHYAGEDYTTGSSNTAIGHQAMGNTNSVHTGSYNVCIGYLSTPSSTSVSNEITLGNSSIATLRCQVTSITSLSDQRDKTAIEDLDLGLDFIKAMKPRKFVWNKRDGTWHGKKEVGFIAQELHEVEMDFNSTDRTRLVNYENPSRLEAQPMNTYPILVKAIQELSAKVDSLQARITELEGA